MARGLLEQQCSDHGAHALGVQRRSRGTRAGEFESSQLAGPQFPTVLLPNSDPPEKGLAPPPRSAGEPEASWGLGSGLPGLLGGNRGAT